MKNDNRIIFFLLSFILFFGCKPKVLDKETFVPFSERKIELEESLSNFDNIKDSLILIREFAHTTYKTGVHEVYAAGNNENPQWLWSAEKWYNQFSHDSLAVYCGGAGDYLVALYEDFGYLAFTVSIAKINPDNKTGHIQVLVGREGDVLPVLNDMYIMDPMFNCHYENNNNELLSLGNHLELLRNNKADKIKLVETASNAKYITNKRKIELDYAIYAYDKDCFLSESENTKEL